MVVVGLGLGGHPGARGAARPRAGRWWWSSATRTTGSSTRPGPCGAPVLIADSTQRQTLEDANVHSAAAVAVLTSDDLTNIETGLAVRDYLGERWAQRPGGAAGLRPRARPHRRAPLRLPPRALHLGPGRPPVRRRRPRARHPRLLHRRPSSRFWSGRLTVAPGRGLDGLAMVGPAGPDPGHRPQPGRRRGRLEHPPRRGTRFAPGDQAYLLGPYEELLRVLRHQHEGDLGPVTT